mmetsp:Transcript_3033/g.6557  ORF Transcript_3033/g.6557 Transcript_3033/m.6557 type:complete len:89 (+) Transcript_3033:805-1071(+)
MVVRSSVGLPVQQHNMNDETATLHAGSSFLAQRTPSFSERKKKQLRRNTLIYGGFCDGTDLIGFRSIHVELLCRNTVAFMFRAHLHMF